MWIFTPQGFYSVVDTHDRVGQLCVRSRDAADLDNLRDVYLPELGETIVGAGTDYPFRAYVDRGALANAMWQIAMDVNYDNFKNEVARVQGYDRAHVYSGVWHQMLKLEDA